MMLIGSSHINGRKTCSNASLPTTDPMWTRLRLNWVHRCERLPTNYMSLDMACTGHDFVILCQFVLQLYQATILLMLEGEVASELFSC
jgi:hypothetical protein